jgi:hypothetical protein
MRLPKHFNIAAVRLEHCAGLQISTKASISSAPVIGVEALDYNLIRSKKVIVWKTDA